MVRIQDEPASQLTIKPMPLINKLIIKIDFKINDRGCKRIFLVYGFDQREWKFPEETGHLMVMIISSKQLVFDNIYPPRWNLS